MRLLAQPYFGMTTEYDKRSSFGMIVWLDGGDKRKSATYKRK